MVYSDINLSDTAIGIVNDIIKVDPATELVIRFAQEGELASYSLGQCKIDDISGQVTLLLTKKHSDDFTITHELLHAYLDKKGYKSIICPSIISQHQEITIVRLSDIIEHKIIIKEQKKRGINLEDEYKKDVEILLKALDKNGEANFDNILNIIEIESSENIYRDLYINHVKINLKKSHDVAKKILDIYTDNDISTAFAARRTLIKTYKEFNKIIWECWGVHENLQVIACISPIFRKGQLNQIANSIFCLNKNSLKTKYGETFSNLHLLSDGQCCFFLNASKNEGMEKDLKLLILKDYLYKYNIKYSLRS